MSIEGTHPGPDRTEPVETVPEDVVARCELLEAVAEAARPIVATFNAYGREMHIPDAVALREALAALDAALSAAGAATDQGDGTCAATSPKGERCKYSAGHDATGEPHSWTLFGFGGPA